MNAPSEQNQDVQQKHLPQCPLCGCQEFQKEKGILKSEWGFSNFELTLLICQHCRFVLPFDISYDNRSIWDLE
jgi:uncharacterized protein